MSGSGIVSRVRSTGSGNAIVIENIPCDTSVYVGAVVKLLDTVAYNALADNFTDARAIGIVYEKPTDTLCHVVLEGLTPAIFTGLIEGSNYFLSSTNPGEMSTSFPEGSPRYILQLGRPYGSTQFILHMSSLIGRSDPAPPPPPPTGGPEDYAGLFLWLRGDEVVKDGLNQVSQWTDKSGAGRHFLDIGRQPLWVDAYLGGKPVLYFDDTPLRYNSAEVFHDTSQSFDTFIIYKPDDTVGANTMTSLRDTSGFGFRINFFGATGYQVQCSNVWSKQNFQTTIPTAFNYMSYRFDGVDPLASSSHDVYHNGTIVTNKFASGGGGGQSSYVGGWGAPSSGDHIKGWIAEIIHYKPGLSLSDRNALETGYIMPRYGF